MIKSYLINLDKDSERLSFVQSNFKKINIELERIPAVDGRTFSEQDYQAFLKDRPRNNKSWMRGQMGCFLSHYTAWQKIAQGDQRFYAVFEDDIHISDDLKNILADDSWIPDNVDIIRLETSTNRVRLTSAPILTHANRKAYGVKSTSWCTGGYIISRKTAEQLVNLPALYHQPSDVILYHFDDSIIAKKLNILQFHPALCTQDKHLVSGTVKFSSNIESSVSAVSQFITKLKQINPVTIATGLRRSLLGYKRIEFH